MKIFITGAEGFIGSHLTEKLVKNGHDVKAFVLYNFGNSNGWLDRLDIKTKKKLKICKGDVRDLDIIKRETKNYNVIIHLAALVGIPYSYFSPRSYLDTNVIGTLNILQAAKENKTSRVIITSTSEVYGTAKSVPIKEDHSLNAQSPYAASKIASDQLALSFYKSYGLPVTIIRPFNTFGPRQSARAIIPTIVTQLLKEEVIRLGNLTPTRDFTYIEDTINAFISAIKTKKISGEVINIGSKFEISIKDILKIINKDFGYNFDFKIDKKRIRNKSSEVYRLYASNAKAEKILKWSPKYSGLIGFKKALKKTINWFEDPKNLKYYNSDTYNI